MPGNGEWETMRMPVRVVWCFLASSLPLVLYANLLGDPMLSVVSCNICFASCLCLLFKYGSCLHNQLLSIQWCWSRATIFFSSLGQATLISFLGIGIFCVCGREGQQTASTTGSKSSSYEMFLLTSKWKKASDSWHQKAQKICRHCPQSPHTINTAPAV